MCERVRTMLVLAACVGALSGCVERRIRVTSEPSGARVWLNDQEIGTTPCEARFTFYGTYDVRLELDGYEPIHDGREAHAPLYEYPGVDLAATLLPLRLENVIDWHYELTGVETGDAARDALRERSKAMRSMAGVEDPDSAAREGIDHTPGDGID